MRQGYSEALNPYLRMVGRFHRYSLHNVLLIALQKPNASHVAGFRTWHKLGRFVRKGEKGILILAPMVKRVADEDACHREVDATRLVGFRSNYVFDVRQAEGAPLPSVSAVSGDPGMYRAKLLGYGVSQGISVEYSADIAPARGVSMRGKILLMPDMSPAEEFATLAHELAHELMHRGERRAQTTKTVRETEAEAVAFVICSAVELETASASRDYIGLYNGDSDLLLKSLARIQDTANCILSAIKVEQSEPATS